MLFKHLEELKNTSETSRELNAQYEKAIEENETTIKKLTKKLVKCMALKVIRAGMIPA